MLCDTTKLVFNIWHIAEIQRGPYQKVFKTDLIFTENVQSADTFNKTKAV